MQPIKMTIQERRSYFGEKRSDKKRTDRMPHERILVAWLAVIRIRFRYDITEMSISRESMISMKPLIHKTEQ